MLSGSLGLSTLPADVDATAAPCRAPQRQRRHRQQWRQKPLQQLEREGSAAFRLQCTERTPAAVTASGGLEPSNGASAPPAPSSTQQSLSQVISDALQDERASSNASATTTQPDLLQTLDLLSGGVTACVTRTWEGRDVWLDVSGTWETGEEARRAAMLSVYHERVWVRNQQLSRMFQLLVRYRPGTVPPEAVDRVTLATQRNTMNGATESLGLPELLLMSVCWLENEQILTAIDQAVEQTREDLKTQPWVQRDPSKLGSLDLQLSSLRCAWRFQSALCAVRLHNARGIAVTALALEKMKEKRNKATQAQQRSLWVQPTADSQQPSTNLTTTPVPATTQQPSPQQQSVWASALKEVDYVAGQVGAFDQPSKGVTGPGCGRVGTVSFGRGGPPPPAIAAQTGNKPGSVTPSQTSVTHNGRARGTLWRYQGVEGSVGFGYDTVRELRAAKAAMSELDAAKESNKGSFSMGAAIGVEKCLRRELLDLLCVWADTHPDVIDIQELKTHCTHSTNIKTASNEHVSRRVTVRAEGAQLPWMRESARSRGRTFLDGWMAHIGNPYQGKEEWDYVSEAPLVWHRFVSIPVTNTHHATLTFFWRRPVGLLTPTPTTIAPTITQPAQSAQPPSQPPSQPASQPVQPASNRAPSPDSVSGASSVSLQGGDLIGSGVSGLGGSVTVSPIDSRQLQIQLNLNELREFLTVLLHAVPAATSMAAGQLQRGAAPAAYAPAGAAQGYARDVPADGAGWIGPPALQVRYDPLPASASVAGDPQAPSDFVIRWSSAASDTAAPAAAAAAGQYRAARLLTTHIQSLLNIYDDVTSRLPELLPVPPPPASLQRAPAGTAADGSGRAGGGFVKRAVRSTMRAVAVAALIVSVPMALGVRLAGWSTHPINSLARNSNPYVATPARPLPTTRPDDKASAAATAARQEAQLAPPAAATSAAAAATAAAAAPAAAASWQPANTRLDAAQLQRLADGLRGQVETRMWLPLVPAAAQDADLPTDEAADADGTGLGSTQEGVQGSGQQYRPLELRYQVVVSSTGSILGVMPLDKVSSRWYSQLPLSGHTRHRNVLDKQDRFISSCVPKGDKPQQPGGFKGLGAQATYTPLKPYTTQQQPTTTASPDSAAAATAAATASTATVASAGALSPQEQPEQVADAAVFMLRLTQLHDIAEPLGKTGKTVALMRATVTPWSDIDSVITWARMGADIRYDQALAQMATQSAMPAVSEADSEPASSVERETTKSTVSVSAPSSQQQGVGSDRSGKVGVVGGGSWDTVIQSVVQQITQAIQQQQGAQATQDPASGSAQGGQHSKESSVVVKAQIAEASTDGQGKR